MKEAKKTKNSMRTTLIAAALVVTLLVPGLVVRPVLAQQPAAPETYVLGAGDTLEIVIFGEPDLSRVVTIKPDGAVSLPLLGEVKAAGKTTAPANTSSVQEPASWSS